MRRIRWIFLVLAACGGCAKSKDAKAPDATVTSQPTDVDEAGRALDDAERALQGALLRGDADTELEERSESGPAPGTTARRRDRRDRCERACRALESMERAAERLCHLAGADDPRCVAARERVEAARRLVEASCPGCGS